MTREEALSLLNKHKDDDVADVKVIKEFVNEIFDYFEPKMEELEELHKIACELQKSRDKCYEYLEELQNRSCESCKHHIKEICKNENSYCENTHIISDVFYCSEWVLK